jgi:hypothetical protein
MADEEDVHNNEHNIQESTEKVGNGDKYVSMNI